MAQVKDLIVNGASRFIGDIYANTAQLTALKAPTSAGGSTYGAGTSGQALMTNGNSIYWGTISTTDTKNTAGSTNSASKLYFIGATTQAANPQTYSHSAVYAENGALTATSFTGNGTSLTALNASNISTGTLNRPLNYNINTNVTFNATKHDATTSPSAISYNNTSNQSIDLGYYITATNSTTIGTVPAGTQTSYSLTLQLNGTSQGAWNGTGNKTINITPSAIGAATLYSPGFTGVPTAPTAAAGTNTTQIATTAFVQAAIQAAMAASY